MAIASELRGPGLIGPHARLEYRALRRGQPLVLVREPMNVADPNAVIAKTVLLQPVAYVAKEHAALIAPKMDRGKVYIAEVVDKGYAMVYPQIRLIHLFGPHETRQLLDKCMEYGASEDVARMIVAGDYMMPDEGTTE